tara:strand:- start:18090 stop:18488 length:399 start_codon:yes stop_codon:yes gene_type:complete
MSPITIDLPETLVAELEESFMHGPMLDDDGLRMLTEEQVGRLDGMSVQIQANEHPPPHFHVRYNRENASFSITDGIRLKGVNGLEKFDKNIKQWWKKNYCKLIEVWNRTRPSDCPVGKLEVPPECILKTGNT